MEFCKCSMFCCGLLCVHSHSSFAVVLVGKRERESKRERWLICSVLLVCNDCYVALPSGATSLSAVCNCGIS